MEVEAGSTQGCQIPHACRKSESSARLAELLEEASGWKALVEAGGGAGGDTDRHKTRADRQADRQAIAQVRHLLCGEGVLDAL